MAAAHVNRRMRVGLTGVFLFIFFLLDLGSLSCAARLPRASRQKLKVHKHLKRLNKPPVKTIQSSRYITYSKEEEAVRSLQSAHGFVLEGRTLRACFGTTKYCHAWLRNAPCTNADCLYLHEFGPQEDSLTKDEIISAYTRNRVQQITGATNEMERRPGNILPPPAEETEEISYAYSRTYTM